RSPIARIPGAWPARAAALPPLGCERAPAPTPAASASCVAIEVRQWQFARRIDQHREERLPASGPVFGARAKDVDQHLQLVAVRVTGEDQHMAGAFAPRQVAERIFEGVPVAAEPLRELERARDARQR